MLTLPAPPRRADLRGFALALALLGGLLLAAAWVAGVPGAAAPLGPAFALLLTTAGLARPDAVRPLYRAWARLGWLYMRLARLAMKALAFGVVAAAGPGPSAALRLRAEAGPRSLWIARPPGTPVDELPAGRPPTPWTRTYVAWARRSGTWWALGLLPFLVVLAAVDVEAEPTLPSQTYTLF